MRAFFKIAADYSSIGFGMATAPALRFIARKRMALPRFQNFRIAQGFIFVARIIMNQLTPKATFPIIHRVSGRFPGWT